MADNTHKIAWKRAELAVNRFVKTAETDISRLQQFKKNIVQHENNGDRSAVQSELSRAQQTIMQLHNNLDSIQKIRADIRDEDLTKFDNKMCQTRIWIMEAINNFADLDPEFIEYLGEDFHNILKSGLNAPVNEIQHGKQVQTQQEIGGKQVQTQQEIGVLESQLSVELKVTEDQEQQIEQLAEDAVHVKDMMDTLSDMVHKQGEAVDSIEHNVETTHTNVKNGGFNLNKAVIAKTAGYTAIGAVCGVLVGGPIGLVAGAKIGALAAGAGLAVGAAAGQKMKTIQRDANEVELQNLHVASDMAETKALRREADMSREHAEE